MKTLNLDVGIIHMVGIGGIGMSGIAEALNGLGYEVRGSDIADSANVKRLRGLGIDVTVGHQAENVADAAVVVISSAVRPDNNEVAAARERKIPVVQRAEMLAELMRLKQSIAVGGTHGKTTTTSLIAAVLDGAGADPTVINGGIINAYGTNARLGTGDWLVAEADESDGTFVKLPATIAVVTNIDPEHLDHYGSFDALRDAFASFVANIPFYGFAVLCADDPEVQGLIARLTDRRIVTYGFSPQADLRAVEVAYAADHMTFDVEIAGRDEAAPTVLPGWHLPMLGDHNISNALAAIALAVELGIEAKKIKKALAGFGGVKRRFTLVGEVGGIKIIDDYAHHPVEIAAVLNAARNALEKDGAKEASGRVVAVFQPHRYSRVESLFDEFCTCFNDADTVLVADIYPAGERPIDGIDRQALVDGLQAHGHREVISLAGPEELAPLIARTAAAGDMVVCLGAGSITAWAEALPAALGHRSDAAGA
ncbi:MAG: UDP-N-acetylmuramate--L-alanine ligase [Alphaproteobacteria bacterium]|nr:UDP-N-acetylmuramate--L-alanine ligase [Alphaproteobacteria bacterium]